MTAWKCISMMIDGRFSYSFYSDIKSNLDKIILKAVMDQETVELDFEECLKNKLFTIHK